MPPTVMEQIAGHFNMTPLQFSVFFGLGFCVVVIAIVVAVMNLSASVPPPEGDRPKPTRKAA